MANMQHQSAGSQTDSGQGQGQYGNGPGAGQGPGEDPRSGPHEYIELPEHQGVIIDYIPPRGGMRPEVGDAEGDDDAQSPDW